MPRAALRGGGWVHDDSLGGDSYNSGLYVAAAKKG